MKKITSFFLLITLTTIAQAQFISSGSNLYHTGGNVGIGISALDALLDIKYTGSPVMNIYRATDVNNQYRWRVDQNFEMFLTNSSGSDIVEIGQDKTYFNNGNVGIGTTSPNYKLHVNGSTYTQGLYSNNAIHIYSPQAGNTSKRVTINTLIGDNAFIYNYDEVAQTFHTMNFGGAHGLTSGVTVLGNGNVGLGIAEPVGKFQSYISASRYIGHNVNGGDLSVLSDNNSAPVFKVVGTGSADLVNIFDNSLEVFTIADGGNVGIGTANPGEKLEVNGNALIDGELYSKKVKVSVSPGNWPDYVFAKSYQLTPLSELEEFIKSNHHLPEVPSAAAIVKEGLDLGEMDATLLKKVEELTLYMIEMKKEIEILKEENKKLSDEVKKVKE